MSEQRKLHPVGRFTPLVASVLERVGFEVHKLNESVAVFGTDENRQLARAFVLETEAAVIRRDHAAHYRLTLAEFPGLDDVRLSEIQKKWVGDSVNPATTKEKTVKKPTTYQEAQALVAKRGRQLDEAKGLAAELRQVPEPHASIAGVAFAIQFDEDGPTYDFLAQRVTTRGGQHRWFTTGSTCPGPGYSWQGLVDFIRSGVDHGPVNPVFPSMLDLMEGGAK